MNLRFVEAFYWLVTLRSVTRAAEKLHLTQSTMSSRVAALEQELGTLLLDRRAKGSGGTSPDRRTPVPPSSVNPAMARLQ